MYVREWRKYRKQSARDADKRKEPNNSEKKNLPAPAETDCKMLDQGFPPDSKSCFRLLVEESVCRSANLILFVAVFAIFPHWTYIFMRFQLFHHLNE